MVGVSVGAEAVGSPVSHLLPVCVYSSVSDCVALRVSET